MVRAIVFCMVVWVVVSILIAVYGHLNSTEKLSVKRSMLYGFITAVVAGGLISAIVFLF